MATLAELSTKLQRRFRDVPNVTEEDTADWIARSMLEHGYLETQDVPSDQELLILLYAEWDGALQVALKTSYYFQFKDSEETVDKRNVSEQYRKVAADLQSKYDRKKQDTDASSQPQFRVMTRADRG